MVTFFYGKPGTGKTLLARTLSDKLQIPLIETNSGQFITKYQGSGNEKLTTILHLARYSCSPKKPFRCIVFIDELDGLSRSREISQGDEERLVNDLLAAISDPKNSDILFIGATNFIDKIDPALKRAGRLTPIELKLPHEEARKAQIHLFLSNHKLWLHEDIITMNQILEKTRDFSSSALDDVMKEALRRKVLQECKNKSQNYRAVPWKPTFAKHLKVVLLERQEAQREESLPDYIRHSLYS